MTDPMAVTSASQSNLAFAFVRLSKPVRRDISMFYAFCRLVDDIADEPADSVESRKVGIGRWFDLLDDALEEPTPFEVDFRELARRHDIRLEHLREILRGVEMDFTVDRYETFDDLKKYCFRVAAEVGIVSARIFGCRNAGTDAYAINLGLALQITNILRDVGQDWREFGRIYLPAEDRREFGYTEDDLKKGIHNEAFLSLMRREADRALTFFQRAKACLPGEDRKAMRAAESMRRIYQSLLRRMERDRFQVFDKRYSVPKWRKVLALLGV